MQLIDTHAHLYLPDFESEREAIISRAQSAGLIHVLLPAIDSSTHDQMLALEASAPFYKAMCGLHPCSVNQNFEAELAQVEALLKEKSFVAIGEIGLDFYWDTTFKQQQYEAFERQVDYALQYQLPIVIHSRNATDECIAVVKKFPEVRGVFHCFSGTVQQAQEIINCGFLLGIGGVVTYKNAGLDAVISQIGIDHLVLETDAPYLSPVPYRGKRNESSYLLYIAQKVAMATNTAVEEVAAVTTRNAINLFNLADKS